jgi:homologs of the eukaryotic argonaute protein
MKEINFFRVKLGDFIKLNKIEKIFYYKLKLSEKNIHNFNKIKHIGKVEDIQERIISTIFKPSSIFEFYNLKPSEFELVHEENIDESKISEKHIYGYLKYHLNLSSKLNQRMKIQDIGDYKIFQNFVFSILKENMDFYMVINFKYSIILKKSMLEIGFNEGDKFRFILNYRITHEVRKILPSDKKKIEEVEKYLKEKYNIKVVDYNQPIIIAENNYSYLPQFCYKVFSFSDIKGTKFSKEIMEKIKISNERRMKEIVELVKQIDFIENMPLKKQFQKLELPNLIVRDKNGVEVGVKQTSEIFRKNYYPYEVPSFLKNMKIETYVIGGQNLKQRDELLKELERRLNLDFEYKFLELSDKVIDKIDKSEKFGLAIIFGVEKYHELKRRLLGKNYISQFIDPNNINDKNWQYYKNNLIFQIASKIGIKYFALESKIPYDYVIGIDVSRRDKVSIGGCAIIYDSSGILKKIVPISFPQKGEKTDLKFVFQKLKDRNDIELENKKILVLRDGRVHDNELEDLKVISRDYYCEILIIGIIKSHIIFLNSTNDFGIWLNFNSFSLLLPHKTYQNNAKPLKLEQIYLVKNGKVNEHILSQEIAKILYELTRLNYSSVNYEYMSIKCPAPIHYVDKFLHFTQLSKGLGFYEEFLKKGFLYFI